MLKFEDIIGTFCQLEFWHTQFLADKTKWITKIGDFVGLTDYEMDAVLDQITVANTAARRQAKFNAAGVPFWESICYRKGESKSWREELSAETLSLFKQKYPDLS